MDPLERQAQTMERKYELKKEFEELTHTHIMEEIAAAAKAGVKQRGR